jgi:hypothetical protein
MKQSIRTVSWALLSFAFLVASLTCQSWFPFQEWEKVQVILYKSALVTGFGYLGFWISRHAFIRALTEGTPESAAWLPIAIVMAACIIGGSMGL